MCPRLRPTWVAPGILLLTSGLGCSDTTGLGAQAPRLAEGPLRIDFGSVYLGAAVSREVPLANVGAGPLRVFEAQGVVAPFEVGPLPQLIYPGNTGTVQLTFRPTTAGVARGALHLVTDLAEPAPDWELLGVGLPPLDCDDHQGCTIDTFDPTSGTCGHQPREGDCDDGSACTTDDRCSGGACLGLAVRCDDGVDCTDDLCDPNRGCVQAPVDTRCADDDPCSIDRCTTDGCENPPAPDGYPCGEVVSCQTAELCLLHQCVEVPIPEGAPCDDGERCTEDDHCALGTCTGTKRPRPATVLADHTLVERPTSGSYYGDRLYVATTVADRALFKVIGTDGRVAAPTHAWPEADGSATLVEVAPARLARVSTSSAGVRWLDVFDASDPDHLRRQHHLRVGYWDRGDETLTGQNGRVYFCAASGPGVAPQLMEVDLNAPGGPGAPVPIEDQACRDVQTGFAAALDVWVSWDVDAAGGSAGWLIYRLSPGAATSIHAHGFNARGVHRYGLIEAVATDGHIVVVDLENDQYLRVLDLDVSPIFMTDNLVSDLPGARLLGVDARRALYRLGSTLVDVDLSMVNAPVKLPDQVELSTGVGWVAHDAARVATWSTLDGLVLLGRTPTGLQPGLSFRGDGSISALRDQPSGLLFSGSYAFGFTTREAIFRGTLADALDARHVITTAPVVLTGPDGPAGLAARPITSELEACSPFEWGCDRPQPTPLPGVTIARLTQLRVAADGVVTATVGQIQMSNDHGAVAAAEGCLGAAFEDYVSAERYLVLDLCVTPGEATVIGELPATVPPAYGVGWVRTIDHGGGFATFVGRGFMILFDFRVPTAPIVAAERYLSATGTGGFLGVAFDGQRWVATTLDDQGAPWIEVYAVAGGAATLVSRGVIDPAQGVLLRNAIALEGDVLHLGGQKDCAAVLLSYSLDGAPPTWVATTPLSTPAVDLVVRDGLLYVARGDGLTVLEPACGP